MNWQIPVNTDHMRKEASHEPSMQYAKDIHQVASTLDKPFTALEIGAAWGFSALAILEAGARYLISVDPNLMAEAHNEAVANGYGDQHVWNCVHSHQYWAENNEMYDLVYIDGSHLYKDVKEDLYEGWKRVNPGGLLMVDDWDHQNNIKAEGDTSEYGVSLACWEFWRDNPKTMAGIIGRVLWFAK